MERGPSGRPDASCLGNFLIKYVVVLNGRDDVTPASSTYRTACCVSADYSEIARESRLAGSDATLVNDGDRGKKGDVQGCCHVTSYSYLEL